MSDEEKKALVSARPPFNTAHPFTPDVYADVTHVLISRNEITMFFGRQLEELDGSHPILPLVRVTVSHDSFVRMFKYWEWYNDFLIEVYDGEIPSLLTMKEKYPERFEEAEKRMNSAASQPEEQKSE